MIVCVRVCYVCVNLVAANLASAQRFDPNLLLPLPHCSVQAPLQAVCKVSLPPTAGLDGPIDYQRDVNMEAW